MPFSGSFTYVILVALLCVGLHGCSIEERASEPLYSLELRDEYGSESVRSVDITVDIGRGENATLELDHIKLTVTPPSPHSLNKLESQLGESSLINSGDQAWPDTVLRPVPQAIPVLTRIQTAIALMKPQDLRIERATANIFESPPSVGFTRIEARGSEVSIATVALTIIESKPVTAVAEARGKRTLEGKPSEHGFTLDGKRWILGESTEAIRVSGRVRAVGAPAQAQEKTVER